MTVVDVKRAKHRKSQVVQNAVRQHDLRRTMQDVISSAQHCITLLRRVRCILFSWLWPSKIMAAFDRFDRSIDRLVQSSRSIRYPNNEDPEAWVKAKWRYQNMKQRIPWARPLKCVIA